MPDASEADRTPFPDPLPARSSAPGGPRHAAAPEAAGPDPEWSPTPEYRRRGRAAHRRERSDPATPLSTLRSSPRSIRPARWLVWAGLVAALLVVAVAAVLVVGVGGDDGSDDDEDRETAASAVPDGVVSWLGTALPDGATVAAPSSVRTALLDAGVDPDLLPTSSPAAPPDPAAPALVITETQPEGSRLVARFDRPGASGPLLVVDPAPVEPTPAELQRRQSLAAAVLANPLTTARAEARTVLSASDVDQRLLTLIAGLTARAGVGIAAFPRPDGEVAGQVPAHQVLIDALGTRSVPGDTAATEELQGYLEAQRGPLAPDAVMVTNDGVLIRFDYVSGPDALVTAAAD